VSVVSMMYVGTAISSQLGTAHFYHG
jgi:hypothetical protein